MSSNIPDTPFDDYSGEPDFCQDCGEYVNRCICPKCSRCGNVLFAIVQGRRLCYSCLGDEMQEKLKYCNADGSALCFCEEKHRQKFAGTKPLTYVCPKCYCCGDPATMIVGESFFCENHGRMEEIRRKDLVGKKIVCCYTLLTGDLTSVM